MYSRKSADKNLMKMRGDCVHDESVGKRNPSPVVGLYSGTPNTSNQLVSDFGAKIELPVCAAFRENVE